MKSLYAAVGKYLMSKPGRRDPMRIPKPLERFRTDLRAWLATEIAPHVDELDQNPTEERQRDLIRKGAAAGWFTFLIPSWYGGGFKILDALRFGFLKGLIFTEELSAVCPGVGVLYGAHALGLLPIFLSFDRRIAKRYLPLVCERAKSPDPAVFAFAITEPSAGSDVEDTEGGRTARLGTFARRTERGYILNGRKCFISNGNLASHVTVFAAMNREQGLKSWTAFVVPREAKGFSVGRIEAKMGQKASPAVELIFDDVFVPEEDRIGEEGSGWALNQTTLDTSRPAVGAIAVGAARHAFEKLIRSFPPNGGYGDTWMQHEIGDLAMKIEAARTLVWRAGGTFPPDPALSAMAKCFASDTAMEVVSRVIDLMGARGIRGTEEVEKVFRDVKLTQIYEGTNQIQRLRIAETLERHFA